MVGEGVPLVGDRKGRTAEAEVCNGVMSITPTLPPPTKTYLVYGCKEEEMNVSILVYQIMA